MVTSSSSGFQTLTPALITWIFGEMGTALRTQRVVVERSRAHDFAGQPRKPARLRWHHAGMNQARTLWLGRRVGSRAPSEKCLGAARA
jgi:hypothetical protein